MKTVVKDLIASVLVVLMLSSSSRNMQGLTLGVRDLMNGFNCSLNTVISSEINF
jgi:hypothetical protein